MTQNYGALTEHLVNAKLVNATDLARAEALATETLTALPQVLTRLGLVPEPVLALSLCRIFNLTPAADPVKLVEPLPAALNPHFLLLHQAVLTRFDDDTAFVATAHPVNKQLIDGLSFALGRRVVVEVTTETATMRALASLASGDQAAATLAGTGGDTDLLRLEDARSEAPVVKLVNRMIQDAASRGASDIHIELLPRELSVRFRIDGELTHVQTLASTLGPSVVSRIKVMAGLDIAEKRLPQDGRIRIAVEGRDLDIRVATTPTVQGEGVVMRLLGNDRVVLDLDRLGLGAQALARLKAALDRPHGIILLTGPTGSGKTTTLYAALERLRSPTTKILTVEDPVEYMIAGINQVQVKPEIGLTYAAALRAFLRQDPDILLVGEIRDRETADIAIRAALTGHLVLSTLHTNTALGAFTRLIDMGVEPFLLAATVRLTAAQRLVRKLCQSCKTHAAPTGDEAQLFVSHGMTIPPQLDSPVGCPACNHSGYAGRTLVIEAVPVTETLSLNLREGRSEPELYKAAQSDHLVSLISHALQLASSGITSMAEVIALVEF